MISHNLLQIAISVTDLLTVQKVPRTSLKASSGRVTSDYTPTAVEI